MAISALDWPNSVQKLFARIYEDILPKLSFFGTTREYPVFFVFYARSAMKLSSRKPSLEPNLEPNLLPANRKTGQIWFQTRFSVEQFSNSVEQFFADRA